MSNYKIYLTKSAEVAHLLSDANRGKGAQSVGSGKVGTDCRIPELYHDMGYYYCILEFRGEETPRYEIVFA